MTKLSFSIHNLCGTESQEKNIAALVLFVVVECTKFWLQWTTEDDYILIELSTFPK